MSSPRATAVLVRVLLRAYPSSFRAEFGDEIVLLALDRRTHGGEAAWRLWPSLVLDTWSSASRLHLEEAMIPARAVIVGAVFALGAFAALSGDPVVGIPLIGLAVGVGVWLRGRAPGVAAPQRSWVRWAVAGTALVLAAVVALVLQGDEELGELAWLAVIGSLFAGLVALGTAAVLALAGRPTSSAA